jgi:hypothetical protein
MPARDTSEVASTSSVRASPLELHRLMLMPPDTFACKVSAFSSMTLAYALAGTYLTSSAMGLLIVMGWQETRRFNRIGHMSCVLGEAMTGRWHGASAGVY